MSNRRTKIAIIAYNCRAGGGCIQTLNLLRAFKNIATDEEFLLVCPTDCGYEDIPLPDGSRIYAFAGPHTIARRLKFEYVTLPRIVKDYQPHVIFGPGNVGLAAPSAPQALFIRQAYLLYDQKHYPNMDLRFRLRMFLFKSQMKRFIAASDMIFCQTPVVQSRFCQKYAFPMEKTTLCGFPTPLEIIRSPQAVIPPIFTANSGKFFVLVLTRHMPHRNPDILIPLCKKYGNTFREKGIVFITTVKPEDNQASRQFLKTLETERLQDLIVNVGVLSREMVAAYLRSANVLWLPTLLECMATPYLEAMSLDVPIMAPSLDFATYVCGDGAIYYDPWNIDSMFGTLTSLHLDQALRDRLIKNAKSQLADTNKFPHDWNEAATIILTQLKNVAIKR